ncbi:MAG: Hsp20/alpha crystallin family protein [Deltaproteobacteria bacterium]|nr:Hsp20/alpha crystallin family protein [Deltaproteobacteria bacterium]
MNHQSQLQAVNSVVLFPTPESRLEKRPSKLSRMLDLNPAPPHALMESESAYSIVFNMLGIEQKGIGIDIDTGKREVTVLARREREFSRNGFFWTFGVPGDALLVEMTARFKAGVLEIVIPRSPQFIVA